MRIPPRKRLKRRDIPAGVRFVTFSCFRRLPLMGNAAIRDHFAAALARVRAERSLELFAWVAMPEHAHVLLRPARGTTLDAALLSLKMSIAKSVINRWRDLDAPILRRITMTDGRARFWQPGGGFDRNVRDEAEFSKEVRYIHRNPVERGLAERPEQWRWSSVRWWMGMRDAEIECDPPPGGLAAWTGFV